MGDKKVVTSIRFLKRSNKPPQAGDVFAIQVCDEIFHFGRVIRARLNLKPTMMLNDPNAVGITNLYLIYVYRTTSANKAVVPRLRKTDLLLPPRFVFSQPWRQGYFETVLSFPVEAADVLKQHCFKITYPKPVPVRVRYADELCRELPKRLSPCGDYGVIGHIALGKQMRQALGLPIAADDE